jgi:hypothetical protein
VTELGEGLGAGLGVGRGLGEIGAVPRAWSRERAGAGRIRKDATVSLCPGARVQVMLNGLSQV